MDRLKLIALDEDDLAVVSAHLQDAVVKVADIHWRPSEKRLVLALNRFDWEAPRRLRRNSAAAARRCASSGCRPASAAIARRWKRIRC